MRTVLIVIFVWMTAVGFAQNPFPENGEVFRDDLVPRIDILIDQDSLDALYAPGNEESNHHYPATFIFDNQNILDTIENVGFRFRGNTSRHSAKKSFKISFNTFESGRDWYGLEKLNINGEHNDPSVARAKICWDYCRQMEIPAPRANHVELYINNEYWGLYINVEHIDEEFAELRFGNKDGNLFKCLWPADLNFKGNDPNLYKEFMNGRRTYALKTNTEEDDYSDLAEFIDILNNTPLNLLPCELEQVFNVDSYLKAIAMDIFTANWDGPIYNKNNFYLYKNSRTGQFEYIPYDLDNTFGIDWFSENWAERNIYNWSKSNRPIYERILDVPEYRARYSYYTDLFLQNIYHPGLWNVKLDNLRDLISDSAEDDPFRPQDYGFTFDHFKTSFDEGLSFFHTPIGIREFMDTRRNATIDQLNLENIAPIITDISNNYPNENQELIITANITDEEISVVEVCYFANGQGPNCFEMFDDGAHNDGAANDGVFGAIIPAFGEQKVVEYFISATDVENKNARQPVCTMKKIYIGSSDVNFVINEVMSNNDNIVTDEFGEYEDWIELYNPSNEVIFLGNYFLSDNPDNPDKWRLPETQMTPNSYLIIWADKDPEQGDRHANFKLKSGGEFVGIFDTQDNNFAQIDGVDFIALNSDEAYGRLPNGTGDFQLTNPTFGASNEPVNSSEPIDNQLVKWQISPNPFSDYLKIDMENPIGLDIDFEIKDALGKTVFKSKKSNQTINEIVSLNHLSAGIYFVIFKEGNQILGAEKVVLER